VKYSVYKIVNTKTDHIYIGMTSFPLWYRLNQHLECAYIRGRSSKFYDFMREYEYDIFSIELISSGLPIEDAHRIEADMIARYGTMTLNERKGHRSILCVDTNVSFSSPNEASSVLGIDTRNIRRCCAGERLTAGGLRFEYL
jgi:hypothetical protein